MNQIRIAILSLFASAAALADCPKFAGEVTYQGWYWKSQQVKIGNHVVVRRYLSGCSIIIFRQTGSPFSQQANLWLNFNGKESYRTMSFTDYEGSSTNQLDFSCPSHDELNFQFALDFGEDQWDNNCSYDYRATLPYFK